MIKQELLEKYKDKLTEEQFKLFSEAVEAAVPLVDAIEKSVETTQNHYGDYMSVIRDLTSAAVLLCAGANRHGVSDACMVLGLI